MHIQMTKKQKSNSWTLFKEYIYILWDGVDQFEHDDNKLERLRGKKPRWYDRF